MRPAKANGCDEIAQCAPLTYPARAVWEPLKCLWRHNSGAQCKERKLTLNEPLLWPNDAAPADAYCGEDERLEVLASFDLRALEGDAELARIARFAAKLCDAPSAAISLVEQERQVFRWRFGLDNSETPRSTSFCAHAMLGSDLLIVQDATGDPRFADFEMVRGDAHVRFYAGAPLISSEGAPLGALCVTDTEPRSETLTEFQREGLLVLAEAVKRRIETHRQSGRDLAQIKAGAERLQFMLDSVPDIAWSASPGPTLNGPQFDYFNARFTEATGFPPLEDVEDWRKIVHPDDFEATAIKFEHALKTATAFEDEWRLRLADGSYRYVLSRAVPSSDDPETARWFGTLTDIDDAYRISQERELLAGELAHRIKNIFSVITGLVTLHSRGDATLKVFADTLSANIRALSRAQDFALKIETDTESNLHSLLEVLMAPYGLPGNGAVTISGDDLAVGPRSTTPIALIFHELATNSAKYGSLSAAEGHLSITTSIDGEDVRIAWRESGGPAASPPKDAGFGSRLMRMTVEHQLGGSIDQQWHSEGLEATITVPRARIAQ